MRLQRDLQQRNRFASVLLVAICFLNGRWSGSAIETWNNYSRVWGRRILNDAGPKIPASSRL